MGIEIIGFTGTRDALGSAQAESLATVLAVLSDRHGGLSAAARRVVFDDWQLGDTVACPTEVHHGDCVGADETFHNLARRFGFRVVIHPPQDPRWRACCDGDDILDERPYLQRNHDIVDACDVLVACPKQSREVLRSGTWATVRYASKRQKHIILVLPDGTLTTYEKEDE